MKHIIALINDKFNQYHNWDFVTLDPIQIPHKFLRKQDIEITAFFAALFALGLRKVIINKTNDLIARMDNSPFDFINNFKQKDLQIFSNFAHRFFKYDDIVFLLRFLQHHYKHNESLEAAFVDKKSSNNSVYLALVFFRKNVFMIDHKKKSEKHISSPLSNSACKRLNLFLRWMIRKDEKGIDFGIWNFIKPCDLVIPLDVHVLNICKRLEIIKNNATASWKIAVHITDFLKQLDSADPIKYDFAFMGMDLE